VTASEASATGSDGDDFGFKADDLPTDCLSKG
jgi:hypothetical protein